MEDSESNATSSEDQTEAFEPPKNRFGIPYLLATDKEEKDIYKDKIINQDLIKFRKKLNVIVVDILICGVILVVQKDTSKDYNDKFTEIKKYMLSSYQFVKDFSLYNDNKEMAFL